MTELISAAQEFILAYQDLLKTSKNNNYKIDQLIQPFISLLEKDQKLKENFFARMKEKTQQLDKQGELLQQKGQQLEQILNKLLSDNILTDFSQNYADFIDGWLEAGSRFTSKEDINRTFKIRGYHTNSLYKSKF